ncbi:MAG TPA: helix-turn-helix transcriptional regulator [Verrucomicrobiae bacterium]|nr:helix-turn-helix transcriptional regulator [Verrucomicrobiae bacterium]
MSPRAERALPESQAARTIGSTIRDTRLEQNMTMEVLAERAELSYQYLSEIERGRCNFSIVVLDRIALALEVSLPALILKASEQDPGKPQRSRRVRRRR